MQAKNPTLIAIFVLHKSKQSVKLKMRKLIVFTFILINYIANAQNNGDVKLEWELNKKLSYGTFDVVVPQIKSEGFEFDLSKKQIFYGLRLQQTAVIDENSLQIYNTSYEKISENELGILNKSIIPTTINAKLINILAREQKMVDIILNPIIKIGNDYQL